MPLVVSPSCARPRYVAAAARNQPSQVGVWFGLCNACGSHEFGRGTKTHVHIQVPRAAAETITEVAIDVAPKPAFDFDKYVAEKAHIVNEALDLAVPVQKPETIHESMRYVDVYEGEQHMRVECTIWGKSIAPPGNPSSSTSILSHAQVLVARWWQACAPHVDPGSLRAGGWQH